MRDVGGSPPCSDPPPLPPLDPLPTPSEVKDGIPPRTNNIPHHLHQRAYTHNWTPNRNLSTIRKTSRNNSFSHFLPTSPCPKIVVRNLRSLNIPARLSRLKHLSPSTIVLRKRDLPLRHARPRKTISFNTFHLTFRTSACWTNTKERS